MDIGIVGLPKSGKTTIFNAVTRGVAQVAAYAGPLSKPNLGVAKLPDLRLDFLQGLFNSKRKVPVEVSYVDVPAPPEDIGRARGITGEMLNHVRPADALLVVTRGFEDRSVSQVADGVDPVRDAEAMFYELAFADLEILERRLARIDENFKGAKAPERLVLNKEQSLVTRLKGDLESGIPVRDQTLTRDEARTLQGYQFLTAKPLIVIVNLGEDQLADIPSLEARLTKNMAGPTVRIAVLCGKLEMELAQMEPEEEREFRETLDLGESGLDLIVKLSHDVLDLVTFYTGNPNEVRAWTVTRGSAALQAAGKIHSDLERGFIRAEVIGIDELERCGSIAQSRSQGLLRQEGKAYAIDNGDVVNILFNV